MKASLYELTLRPRNIDILDKCFIQSPYLNTLLLILPRTICGHKYHIVLPPNHGNAAKDNPKM